MELNACRIFTDDVDALITFYESVTGVTANRLHPLVAEFSTRTGTLAIASTQTVPLLGPDAAAPRSNRSVSFDFLVDDVDATWTALEATLDDVISSPKDMPWGNRCLLFRDPDGNLVNLFTPTSESARARFGR